MSTQGDIENSVPFTIKGVRLAGLVPSLISDTLPTLSRLSTKHSNWLSFNAGKYQRIEVVSDPEIVKYLLKTNSTNYLRSPVIKALKPLLGEGIFINEGETWKRSHNMLKPAMHEKHMAMYSEIVQRESQALIDRWRGRSNAFEIENEIDEMMLRILVQTLFGDIDGLDYLKILQAHKSIIRAVGLEKQKVGYFKNKLLGKGYIDSSSLYKKDLSYLESVAEQILTHSKTSESPLFQYLGEHDASPTEWRDMILNLLFAGYDTTASALSWAIYCLSCHPEEQKHCRTDSSYLKKAIDESMRLFPPVWSMHRRAEADDSIHGVPVKSGTYFMINIYALHRNPKHWKKPDSFYPKHFAPDQMKGKAFTYIPFGQGQRMCIGKPLAMWELEIMLSRLLSQLEFANDGDFNNPPKIRPDIIVKSKKGLRVRVRVV